MHALIALWFAWLKSWGYLGVVILMALESTVVPVPSEMIVPPAAFWAAQGELNFFGVVVSAVIGSYLGSALSYAVMYWAQKAIIGRFGKIPFVGEEKSKLLEQWVLTFGVPGVFFARLLPVVRHLISLPAGMFKMNFLKFSIATIAGSTFWCFVLAWWGEKVIGPHPELMNSPEDLLRTVRTEMHGFVFAILGFAALYVVMLQVRRRLVKKAVT